MSKTKNAFALKDFDGKRILQRPFFKNFFRVHVPLAILNPNPFSPWQVSDAEILNRFNFNYADGLEITHVKLATLDDLFSLMTSYQKRLKRHVGRLTNYTNAVANKIAVDETGDVANLRERHKRATFLLQRYCACSDDVHDLDKKISVQYKKCDDEVKATYRKMFAERLKQARLEAGLTQAQLGERLKLSQKTISSYEKGTREPSIAHLASFSYILQKSIGQLLGLEK